MDINEVLTARKEFDKDEWIDFMLRSTWMEPTHLENNVKWHLLERLVPLVENNYNLCELWPRGTGKSYVYKEISPNSILISWGQTTVANLFYNMSNRTIWLVWLRDVVAFDEVAWINFKDKVEFRSWRTIWTHDLLHVAKKKRLLQHLLSSYEILIKVSMLCSEHLTSSLLFLKQWTQIQHFLIVCITMFHDGKYQSLIAQHLQMSIDLLLITWLNFLEKWGKLPMQIDIMNISVSDQVLVIEIVLL